MATILIVDDHAINRQFLQTLLGYGGHVLLEAADGTRALSLALAEHPDLVITDILMPNMDGYEFVTHMRSEPSLTKIPVIFYTASYREREARSMAHACGVQWVLSKPSEPELILQTVQEALGFSPAPAGLPVSQLSASLEADKFSTINDQLRGYLVELGTASGLLSQIDENSGMLEAQRDTLRQIANKLTTSLGSLQQVSVRLTRLIELGLDLAAERDPVRMLEILCRTAHNICGAKYAAVGVLDDNGSRLGYCFARGIGNDVIADLRAQAPGTGVLGRLFIDSVPCRLNNLDGNAQSLGLPRSHPSISSFLGVPISSKERTYGWLYVAEKLELGDFSDVDEQVVATIASQLAVAYENLILYDEVHQHRAQLQMEVLERKQAQETLRKTLRARTVAAECNHVLVHATDEMALLNEMCRTIVATGGYPMVWIGYTTAADDPTLSVVAQAGMAHDNIGQSSSDKVENRRQWYPARIAVSEARPHVIADVLTDPAFARLETPDDALGYRSALSLPLKDNDMVFGVLTIYHGEPKIFGKDQIEMLEELAGDIAYGAVSLRTRRAREYAEQSLVATQEKLTGILNSIDNIVWSVSEHKFLYISPVAEKIYGRPLAEFYQNKDLAFDVIHPQDQPHVRKSTSTLREHGSVTREYRILRPDGSIRWLEDRTTAVFDPEGSLVRFDGVASDITGRKKYEARIEYLATHDPLTGLANRNLLHDRLAQAIAFARRSQQLLALLFIDLDRFKDINDSFGHAVGDALLKSVAARLRSVVREGDTVARPGGDEFIVLLTTFTDQESVINVATKILKAFSIPFAVNDVELHVTPSIGISVYPTDGENIEALLRNTDTAMYRVKERGGNGSQLYSHDMSVRAIERMELENALHRAAERQDFELYYQPKINLDSGQIIGVEALMRWAHPDMGEIPPDRFIPVAEEIGLISQIGEWALKTACLQNKAWQDAGLPPITVSVNLSARQFRHDELVKTVASALSSARMEAQYLELELTESLVMHSAEQFTTKLKELKNLGVQLSIDDFGTGYSSLSYLKRFSLDRLKIDQSFVKDIVADADDAAITRSIISLGHSLNLKVVAEGVETREQIAFLRAHACDEIQGHYFSTALPAGEFEILLREGRTLARE